MKAVAPLDVPYDGWTVDDLERLFPGEDIHCELVDGALLVTPPEAPGNKRVASRLHLLLAPVLSPDHEVLLAAGLHFDRRNYREPDLYVCRRDAVDRGRVVASDVLLAVEVMSPSSVATDRVAKPAQYAAAGIAHYWRVERDPRLLVTHALAGGVYRETGRFADVVELAEPASLRFRLCELFE